MKRLSCLLLGILLVFSLCACQQAAPSSGEAPDQQAITEEATEYFNQMMDGDFETFFNALPQGVQDNISAETIQETWEEEVDKLGGLPENTSPDVSCYDAKIVSFGSGVISKIAGLFGGGGGGGGVSGFATGGFTSGPSIAGEDPRYPTEAVISFNPAYRSENLEYWAKAGQMLGASNESDYELLSGGSSTSVVYDLSGLSFSPQIKIEGDTDEDALIRKLRELEPEFIDFVLEALSRREGGAYVTADSRLY